MCNKAVFPQQYVLFYLCQWCTVLCHARAVTLCCTNYHSVPSCCPVPPAPRLYRCFRASANLSAAADSRGVGKQSVGILGDAINGPDRFVYLTYCKWRRLYAVCIKCCCVSLCLWLFCIVTLLCIASGKIKKFYWYVIVFSAVIMYRYISRSAVFPVSPWILTVPHQKHPTLQAAYWFCCNAIFFPPVVFWTHTWN